MEHNYYFFWKARIANWTKSNFIVDLVQFNCGEQYMMYKKAMLFSDYSIADKILNETDPKTIKDLGRKVKNFNSDIWDKYKYQTVKTGLKERFTQDLEAKEALLKYKGKIFVEASPYDRIWGIGYDKDNALDNINNWGENLLGKILTELSNEI